MSYWLDFVGYFGVVLVLAAYVGVSNGNVSPRSVLFQLVNAAGAVMIAVNSYVNHALPSVVINVIWAFIAVYSLILIWIGYYDV